MKQAFRTALDHAHDRGERLRFWLRDDDATEPSAPLERLLDLCAGHGVPPVLAVIPARARADLAQALEREHAQALEHTKLQERMQIAHDLHDGLGASLVRGMALPRYPSLRFGLQMKGQKYAAVASAAIIMVLEPLLTVIAAALWYGEQLPLQKIIGGMLILVAQLWFRWRMLRPLR